MSGIGRRAGGGVRTKLLEHDGCVFRVRIERIFRDLRARVILLVVRLLLLLLLLVMLLLHACRHERVRVDVHRATSRILKVRLRSVAEESLERSDASLE